MRVVVVGAGVIGLTTAHALTRVGHQVSVLARERHPAVTSSVAGASFRPTMVSTADPFPELLRASRDEVLAWETSGFSSRLGMHRVTLVEASAHPVPRGHLDVFADVEVLDAQAGDDIPGGYPHALRYRTWVFDVPVAMAALEDHLDDLGVAMIHADLASLHDPAIRDLRPEVVVNATGVGARDLVGDDDLVPIRGQVVLVDPSLAPPDLAFSADGNYAYARRDSLLLGGTAEEGVWDRATDPGTVARILAVNDRVVPGVAATTPLTTAAGLRPYRRSGIRLAVDTDGPVPVIHAYGHGGAGWTLAPGTARWVADAVGELAGTAAPRTPPTAYSEDR
jgi:D-amino-acid oxidase